MAHVDIDVCKLDFSKVPIFVSMYKGKQLNSIEGADREGLKQLVKEAIEHESQKKETTKKVIEPEPRHKEHEHRKKGPHINHEQIQKIADHDKRKIRGHHESKKIDNEKLSVKQLKINKIVTKNRME